MQGIAHDFDQTLTNYLWDSSYQSWPTLFYVKFDIDYAKVDRIPQAWDQIEQNQQPNIVINFQWKFGKLYSRLYQIMRFSQVSVQS